MTTPRILVVDDDPDLLDLIAMRLASAGYEVTLAASGEEALARFRTHPPRAVITDLRMDGMDGHALFECLHAEAPSLPVIMLTAHGTIPDAVSATQRGVFSFLTKPFDGRELLARVADAVALSPPLDTQGNAGAWRRRILSSHPAMDELLRNAHRQADTDVPVLIRGPRGSGKELLAEAIHEAGPRARHAFRILRCGATTDSQAATAELLGHLEAAAAGTLYLDDIDLLPLPLQARLLPHVGTAELFVGKPQGARIIAATAQALDSAVRAGSFRADLFYTLGRSTLTLPALADRREDIPLLVAHFTQALTPDAVPTGRGFAPDALALLCDAPWPGNVRQLKSLVEQALVQSVVPLVPASLVRKLLKEDNEREMAAFDEARRAFEFDYLEKLLISTAGNVAQAARIAQRNRTEFYKLLARHDLDPAQFKQGRK